MQQQDYLQQLTQWYQTPLGIYVARSVKSQFDNLLKEIFGYYLLDLGVSEQQHWLHKSTLRYHLLVNTDLRKLAIASESVDCVLMCHSLECYKPYQTILAEAERILLPEGKLLIISPYVIICRRGTGISIPVLTLAER